MDAPLIKVFNLDSVCYSKKKIDFHYLQTNVVVILYIFVCGEYVGCAGQG